MAKYTMKDFISGKIAVHTGLDSQKFLELCDKHGLKWAHGDKATDWTPKRYGEDTCIVCELDRLMHGPIGMFGRLVKRIVAKPEDIAEMAPKYTMKDFIEKPIAVCVGQKHVKEFLEMCEAEGLKWRHGDKPTDRVPDIYDDELCITLHCKFGGGKLMAGDVGCYMRQNLTIVDFTDIVSEKKPAHYRIVIDCMDDKVTKAHMYTGSKEVKTAIARRNPVDEFDFAIGAKVAFDRLFGKEPSALVESAPEPKPEPIKVGDRVRCVNAPDGKSCAVGMYGTVKAVDYDMRGLPILVEFDEDVGGHNKGGCKAGHGWWCPTTALELVTIREVKRHAKVGEWVKIVKPYSMPDEQYKTGDILKVTDEVYDFGVRFTCGGIYCDDAEYVVLEGYTPTPAPAPEPKPAHKFKVGDRAKCIKAVDCNDAVVGKYGTVKRCNRTGAYAVEFDAHVNGHDCTGNCKDGHGWYCPVDALEPAGPREFKVGDRVRCTQAYSGNLRVKNARGTVKIVNEQQIGVEFDEDVGGHTLNKYAPQAKRGRGWYCSPEVLEHED